MSKLLAVHCKISCKTRFHLVGRYFRLLEISANPFSGSVWFHGSDFQCMCPVIFSVPQPLNFSVNREHEATVTSNTPLHHKKEYIFLNFYCKSAKEGPIWCWKYNDLSQCIHKIRIRENLCNYTYENIEKKHSGKDWLKSRAVSTNKIISSKSIN